MQHGITDKYSRIPVYISDLNSSGHCGHLRVDKYDASPWKTEILTIFFSFPLFIILHEVLYKE